MERVTAYENLRGLVYTPFYVGMAEGLFAQAGVDLQATLSPSGEETAAGAAQGRVDVAWGGPMRVMRAHDRNADAGLVCFGLAVARDPFLIVAGAPDPGFTPARLVGKRLAVATHAPTPWLLLQEDVRRSGLDPAAIDRTDPAEPADALADLADGRFDYVLAFEPWGAIAEAQGGHVVSAGARRGTLAFTSFYGPRKFLADRPEAAAALIKGLGLCLARVNAMPAAEAAAAIKPWFPEFEDAILATAIARYQRLGLWPQSPEITVDGFVRLKSALIAAGFIASDPPFERLVAKARSS